MKWLFLHHIKRNDNTIQLLVAPHNKLKHRGGYGMLQYEIM